MAVIFSEVPPYYSSVFTPLTYRLSNIPADHGSDIEIYTTAQNEPIGIKRIAAGDAGEVNISGYMRRCISPQPFPVDRAGLFQDAGRYVTAGVMCREVMSPIRTYVGAGRRLYEFEMLSVLPQVRTIAWGESDELSFVVPNSSLTYSISLSGTKNYVFESPEYIASRGVVTMTIGMPAIESAVRAAGMRPEEFSRMSVRVMNAGKAIGQADYRICRRPIGSVRLCWFNALGGLDCHTFEGVLSERVSVGKETFLGNDGYSPALIRRLNYTELQSGYLPRLWVEGLADLLSSPLVWRVEEETFIPVDVLSQDTSIYRDRLNSLAITIRNRIPCTCQNL